MKRSIAARFLVSFVVVALLLAPTLALAQSTGVPSDFHARLNGAGPVPVLSTCGTAPTIAGNDNVGTITIGTGTPSACTMTFSKAFTTGFECVFVDNTTIAKNPSVIAKTGLTAVTVTFTAATVNGDVIGYLCLGR